MGRRPATCPRLTTPFSFSLVSNEEEEPKKEAAADGTPKYSSRSWEEVKRKARLYSTASSQHRPLEKKGMIRKPARGRGNFRPQAGGTAAAGTDQDQGFHHEIEALRKSLSLDPKHLACRPAPPSDDRRSHSVARPNLKLPASSTSDKNKEKKKPGSLWGWNPFKKALSHIGGHRRFDCCFTLHVHSIEGLPGALTGASISVHWRRTTDPASAAAATLPARVLQGVAQFEETLTYRCSVQGTRTGPGGTAKYESRHFLIYPALAGGAPGLDLGRHLVDLVRVLPATLEELEDEKAFGEWSTSYRLSGKARGASLNVSFGFSLFTSGSLDSSTREKKVSDVKKLKERELDCANWQGSLQIGSQYRRRERCRSVEDVKVLHEVLPNSKPEVSLLPRVENNLELRSYGIAEELYTFNGDKERDFKLFCEQEQLAESKPSLFEPLEGTEDESHMLKPSILLEPVKESNEHNFIDPELMVIENALQIASEYKTCEFKIETEKMESAGIGQGGESKKEEGPELEPDELDGEVKGENKPGVKLDETDKKGAQRDCLNLLEAAIFIKEDMKEDCEGIKPGKLVMEEDWRGSHSVQEAAILSLDPVIVNHDVRDASLKDTDKATEDLGSVEGKPGNQQNHGEIESNYKLASLSRSHSLDVLTESVASEFLSMLGLEYSPFGFSSESEAESPREQLWKQFEKESLAAGSDLFGLHDGIEQSHYWDDFSDDLDLSLIIHEAEAEFQKINPAMSSKSRAKMLEDAETEALMREWGLNEKAFNCSPPESGTGFGSPVDLPPEQPELPPLGEGLGPIVRTKDGGFLRSMNPLLFRNAKNNGNLIMQVSSPVVVPAEMGSGIMEILPRLASEGIEKLSRQASKLMPLEDITGKTMQQIAWDSMASLDSCLSHDLSETHHPETGMGFQNVNGRRQKDKPVTQAASSSREIISEYVTLEDLTPMAMDKIEALSIEGLRIQTGMSDEDAPSNITSHSIGEFSALNGKGTNNSCSLGLEGTAGLQLLDVKGDDNDVDGLMGLSITLDEWMKLDSGIIDEEDLASNRASKILAAHHVNSSDLYFGAWKGDKRGKRSGGKWGLLGNNFTVALMIQLRNPLRNYEPVGTPMLALVQVERVFVPPKPKIYSTVSEKGNSEQEDEIESEGKLLAKEEKREEVVIPQFKITEVHVAGIKTEPGRRSLWSNPMQQQSGSRWLLAAGMSKNNKHPLMKSNAAVKPSQDRMTTARPGDALWSISSRVHGTGAKWKEQVAVSPHVRNPNVVLPNESIRLR